MSLTDSKLELKKMLYATVVPAVFLLLCWFVFVLEVSSDINLSQYGLRPRNIARWYGIFTMPFLHGSLKHIAANSVSFFVMGTMLFYFYNAKAFKIFIFSYLFSGLLTWIIGRNSVHIGASAMIYAFAGYLFTAGVLSKNIRLMALSLIIVFLYGSMIWGIFPIKKNISWEGHLAGLITGVTLAFIYRPPAPPPIFDDDDDDDDDEIYFDTYHVDNQDVNAEE